MLARRRTLLHPSGAVVDMPLLVPSFTSKGFGFFKERPVSPQPNARVTKAKNAAGGLQNPVAMHEYSETTNALASTAGGLAESLLISSYDIYHRHYRDAETFLKNTALVFLDSGGYELTPDFDSTEPKVVAHSAKPFTAADYDQVLKKLTRDPGVIPLAISNFDWDSKNLPIESQILAAQALFNRFPDCLSNFIIKPHTPTGHTLDMDEIVRHIRKLRAFGIIGVTEKELGKNLMDRLKSIAKLRQAMDDNSVSAPIHVWGGLDPVITPLYFFAGAEIFDGVSWLRYAFHQGMAVNRESHGFLGKHGIETPHDHLVLLCINENLTSLQRLGTNLREFADSKGNRYEMFEPNSELFERAYRTMTTKIPQLKRGE